MKAELKPIARQIILDLLKASKTQSMVEIYERVAPGADGRIRTSLSPVATITGRFGSSATFLETSTNLQNIPKKIAKLNPLYDVRTVMVPDPGYILLEGDLCVGPHTKILKADLTWSAAKDLTVGNELIGFSEDLARAACKYTTTAVTANDPITQFCIRVITDKGEVTCSLAHSWVTRKAGHSRVWAKASDLVIGDRIMWIGFPWVPEYSYEAGWLAGLFDGEGHFCDSVVGFTQKKGKGVWERAIEELDRRGFNYKVDQNSGGIPRANFRTKNDNWRFLGQIRPQRLLSRAASMWEGRCIHSNKQEYATVLHVYPVGERIVYPVSTESHTFIAEGMLSHNSQAEARATSAFAGDERTLDLFDSGADIHKVTAASIFNCRPEEVSANQRQLGKMARHALNYGMGWKRFLEAVNSDADLTGVSISARDAKAIVEAYHAANPALTQWWRKVEGEVRSKGFLVNPFGRKLIFVDQNDTNSAIAFLPQSTIADHLNALLVWTFDTLDQKVLTVLLQIHDAILAQAPAAQWMQAARALKAVMDASLEINHRDIRIPADISASSSSWGEMKKVAL